MPNPKIWTFVKPRSWQCFTTITPEAARILHCDPETVRSTVPRHLVGAPLALQGRKGVKHASRNCTAPVEAELLKLLKQDECLYLGELAAELQARTGTSSSVPGVCRALQEMEWTRNKVSLDLLSKTPRLPYMQQHHTNRPEHHSWTPRQEKPIKN